ncbi:hypothetical protein [Deinococcus multiflagellatus]|uniref:Uncharacterized protein n=1 Tax=Deinococcus multiflagellatus TaxID=1656887 RepID=A0ABW1ZSP1_9DEIO|nr:hypothetical protein [Deinococcus multiflagellatus]MBZ9715841.1 hypothetical protein [Deinococcus multiflagellatus]
MHLPIERTLKAVHLAGRELGRDPTLPEIAEACAVRLKEIEGQVLELSRYGYTRLNQAGVRITDAGRAAAQRPGKLIAA